MVYWKMMYKKVEMFQIFLIFIILQSHSSKDWGLAKEKSVEL